VAATAEDIYLHMWKLQQRIYIYICGSYSRGYISPYVAATAQDIYFYLWQLQQRIYIYVCGSYSREYISTYVEATAEDIYLHMWQLRHGGGYISIYISYSTVTGK
jgi:hypothetical protein